MSSPAKENDAPSTKKEEERKEVKEKVCCFFPLRSCAYIFLLLLMPILILAMYSAFYDPQYIYVIIAYGVPGYHMNQTNVVNKTAPIGGETIFYSPFENHISQIADAKSSEETDSKEEPYNLLQSKMTVFLIDFPYYYRLIFYGEQDEGSRKNSTESSDVKSGSTKEGKLDNGEEVDSGKEKDNETEHPGKVVVVPENQQEMADSPVPESDTALAIIDLFQEKYFHYDTEYFNIPNPNVCDEQGQNVTMIIGIHSLCVDFERRHAIRASWAQLAKDTHHKYVFFLGFPRSSNIMNRIMHESHEHRDIIQTSFIEGSNTETAQSVMFLKWVSRECPKAKWVMKTEDDVFVNLPYALYNMNEKNPLDRSIYGFVDQGEENPHFHNHHDGQQVVATTISSDASKHYPVFIGGAGYILPGFLAQDLYNAANNLPTLQFESMFITGILAEAANITRIDVPWFDASSVTDIPRDDPCSILSISIVIHPFSADDMTSFWQMLRDNSFNCGNFKFFVGKMESNYTNLMYSSSLNNPKLNLVKDPAPDLSNGHKVVKRFE